MAEIQIFGTNKCSETRKAMRFFQERRVKFHFRDLSEKGISKGELDSIKSRINLEELIDREGKRYREKQLQFKLFDVETELLADGLLFKTPIVRYGKLVTLGGENSTWAEWIKQR